MIEPDAATLAMTMRLLCEKAPNAFGDPPPGPLALGIRDQLEARFGLTRTETRAFLRWYTARPAYFEAVARGGRRINLDGTEAEPVAPEHCESAKWRLAAVRHRQGGGR
jgi:sRNA-binding protein